METERYLGSFNEILLRFLFAYFFFNLSPSDNYTRYLSFYGTCELSLGTQMIDGLK